MSMIADKIRVEGNNVIIRSNPYTGIIALTSFVDDASGVDGTHTFIKKFRYSNNGIIFSDWFDLTTNNILSISVSEKDTLIIELSYVKNQPAGDDLLNITQATIGTTNTVSVNGIYFSNSIFKNHFNSDNLDVLNWQINVLDKLYKKGLLPSYISRLNDFDKPDDFIEFWRAITKYFAYYVVYARSYQKFYESDVLLAEYIKQRGMIVSPLNTLNELNYLMENFYKEIFHRGTIHIVDKMVNGSEVDGELLRLIKYNEIVDEFIFNIYRPEHFGWNLGNASPLYKGMRINDNVNKFYEKQVEVNDIAKYPVTASSVSKVTDSGHSVLNIVNGGITSTADAFKIKVNEFVDYELFFLVKLTSGDTLSVGFNAYDKDGTLVDLESYKDGTAKNWFFQNQKLQRADKYIGVSLFLYNKLKPLFATDTTLLQVGTDLKLKDGVTFVIPKIITNGTIKLYNMRLTPMITSYSRGFLDVRNFISIWIKNNNNDIDLLGINQFIKRYLIPLNTNIELSEVEGVGDYSQEVIPV